MKIIVIPDVLSVITLELIRPRSCKHPKNPQPDQQHLVDLITSDGQTITDNLTWKRYQDDLESSRIKLSSSGVEDTELLFHYTSAEACFSIIEIPRGSEQGPSLWASCALGMNDAREIRYGIDVVYQIASKHVPKEELDLSFAKHKKYDEYAKVSFFEQTCIACFCDKPDLLSQWRAYGKDATGYCIGFRRDALVSTGSQAGFNLVPIIYDRESQLQKVNNLFEETAAIIQREHPQPEWRFWRMTIDAATKLSLGFKHASFSEEREWRLISKQNPRSLKFRAGRSGVIPYVQLSFPKDALASIWQGPTLDHDLTRRTLEMYLAGTYGMNFKNEYIVQVRGSEIPLRKLEN